MTMAIPAVLTESSALSVAFMAIAMAGYAWVLANLAIYLTPPTPTRSVLGCGRGLSQDVA
jgi:hypothetical protein